MAGSPWNRMPLGDFVTFQRGHDLPDAKRRPGDTPVLGSFGVTGWHDKARAAGPGVTVGRSGASLGVASYSPVDYWPLNTTLYVVDFHGNDKRFAYYFLKQFDFWIYNSGSAQPSLNRNFIHPIPVDIPPLPEQRAIAHVLGTLDDKIELNRRMNETLEEMARALFKSWFVDFDPVRAKTALKQQSLRGDEAEAVAAPASQESEWTVERARAYLSGMDPEIVDLFPDRLVDSALGEIPEGWEVAGFNRVVMHLRSNENPLASPETVYSHYSIPAYDNGQAPRRELGMSIKSVKTRVPLDSVLLSKLNPEIERVWLPDVTDNDRAICSTEFMVLQPKPPFDFSYVYSLVRSAPFRERLQTLVTGTSKSHQRAPARAILSLDVLYPPAPTLQAFQRTTSVHLNQTVFFRRESATLTPLRDTLLPKLVSGEIPVEKRAEDILL